MITPLDLNNVQLRSGRILEKRLPLVVIQESREDEPLEKEISLNQEEIPQKKSTPIHDTSINSTPIIEQPFVSIQNPPFLERLKIRKGIEKQIVLREYDMLDMMKIFASKFLCYKLQGKYQYLQRQSRS